MQDGMISFIHSTSSQVGRKPAWLVAKVQDHEHIWWRGVKYGIMTLINYELDARLIDVPF